MASLIEGYEYDIFISYRQKDNKYDGWVSEFIDHLKKELEATFKEEISVYFDINPYDGLLETHDVDASLKEKLKCLVFIPIISHTYCDPKSFAWQYEFCAFNKLAKEDQFGRDIKLTGGNVASRILPIKIHDLDPEDKTLLENELRGVLRYIEFIYKSAGVNRPLRANEDHPQDNLNKSYYRDQINKVANAVKEIITSIKKSIQQDGEVRKEVVKVKPEKPKNLKIKIIAGVLILMALFVIGYLFIPRFFKLSEQLEKSIAVLPFVNDSPDKENTYFINGIMDEILNNLQKIKDIRIISRTSVEKYRNQTKSTPEIAKELHVNYIVEGSGQKYGNVFRLRVQLIMAAKESHLWAESYEQEILEPKDIFKIQSQIARAIATELKAVITPLEKQLFEKPPTANMAAYDTYLKGQFFYEISFVDKSENEKAIFWFKESIKIDSTFALPWTYLSMCYWRPISSADAAEFKEAKRAAEKALELDPTSGTAIVNMAEILDNEYDFEGAEKNIKLALKIDSKNPYVLRNVGRFYTILGKGDESISFCNLSLQDDPINVSALQYLAMAFFYTGRYTEAWETLSKYQELEYKGLSHLYYQLLLEEGKLDEVVKEPSFEQDDNARYVALAAVNFKLGNKSMAEKLCANLIQKNITNCSYWIAFAHAYGDEPEKVFTWLERSFATKERQLTYLGVDPAFKKFRNEPRVKELLQKMKFPIWKNNNF